MKGHCSRANGREESARFTRGQDEKRSLGGLFQELQERVGRFLARFLGNECLGVPDHEYLPKSHAGAAVRMGAESLGHGKVEPGGLRCPRRGAERTLPSLSEGLVPSFFHGLGELVRAGPLGLGEWKIPMEVGMLEIDRHPACLAVAARAVRTGFRAEKELAEPECESLFAYTSRTVDEHAGWKRIAGQGPRERRLKICVTEKGVQAHPPGARSQASGSWARGSPPSIGART